jgi:urease accessory protein
MTTATLLLADARFPAGGHAHSGGVEPAVTAGTVTDLASLGLFLRGRLRTAGLTAAGLAAAACAWAGTAASRDSQAFRAYWGAIDAEADARTPSPAQREASRRQGRALLRAARAAWPDASWLNDLGHQPAARASAGRAGAGGRGPGDYRAAPHHAVVLGASAAAAGCSPAEAARIAAYQAVAGPASAAIRLLALDPMQAMAIVARLASAIDAAAGQAARCANGPLADLPFPSAPALDLLAQAHARVEVRLFDS